MSDSGLKCFWSITPPLQPRPDDLTVNYRIKAKAIRLFLIPQQIVNFVPSLLSLRKELGVIDKPLIIWEPAPPLCDRENLDSHSSQGSGGGGSTSSGGGSKTLEPQKLAGGVRALMLSIC